MPRCNGGLSPLHTSASSSPIYIRWCLGGLPRLDAMPQPLAVAWVTVSRDPRQRSDCPGGEAPLRRLPGIRVVPNQIMPGIPLLTAFALGYLSQPACRIPPAVCGGLPVEQPHKRQQLRRDLHSEIRRNSGKLNSNVNLRISVRTRSTAFGGVWAFPRRS